MDNVSLQWVHTSVSVRMDRLRTRPLEFVKVYERLGNEKEDSQKNATHSKAKKTGSENFEQKIETLRR